MLIVSSITVPFATSLSLSGYCFIKYPDLRDYEINYIEGLLIQKGLEWNITEQYSENIKSGYLIKQYPERDKEVTKEPLF